MENLSTRLHAVINSSVDRLNAMSREAVLEKPNPNKWSKQEILGHLIDSAANNHRRFMVAQFKDDLVFKGYAQDQWVEYQDYQNAEWKELCTLWVAYNKHLCRVIENIPKGILRRSLTDHNFHLVAFKTVPKGEPSNLSYFIDDYINHIEHHLDQILS